jgi:hypothetical protein
MMPVYSKVHCRTWGFKTGKNPKSYRGNHVYKIIRAIGIRIISDRMRL